MEQFITYYDSLIVWFISKVSAFKSSDSPAFSRKDIILYAIKSGSIDINAGLQMENSNNVKAVSTGLTNAMNSGS